MNGVRLVIVVPCYNEEEVLKETTRQLSDVLARMEQEGKVAEGKILYVDDGRLSGRDWILWRPAIMMRLYLSTLICRMM